MYMYKLRGTYVLLYCILYTVQYVKKSARYFYELARPGQVSRPKIGVQYTPWSRSLRWADTLLDNLTDDAILLSSMWRNCPPFPSVWLNLCHIQRFAIASSVTHCKMRQNFSNSVEIERQMIVRQGKRQSQRDTEGEKWRQRERWEKPGILSVRAHTGPVWSAHNHITLVRVTSQVSAHAHYS